MNSRTAPFPNYYYHYFPFTQPRMECYPYQAPYFQTYMGCLPKKEEQSVQNYLKNDQIEKQRNTTERKSKKLSEKKSNPLKSPRKKSQKKEKDQEYQERKQTPQRNTLSNTIKFFLRYAILKPQLARPEVKKILENLNCKYDSEEFLRAFENQFSGKMNYISKNNIERIWLGELNSFSSICENQKVEFCLVFRELFHIYFERIIYEERFSGKQKKRKFELDSKKRIKNFIKQLQNKLKRKNEALRTEN